VTEYISATPEPPGPVKGRPSAVWFLVGGLLVVAGVVAGIVLVVRIFDSGFLGVEANVPADGAVHEVMVGTDGDRFLWEPQYGAADCVVRDRDSGGTITLEPVSGTYTRQVNADAWQAAARFDRGSGRLAVTCSPEEGPAQIGPALDVADFVARILVAVLVPLALIGLGLATLVGTGVLWATRPEQSA
jgi:hypothetical protein